MDHDRFSSARVYSEGGLVAQTNQPSKGGGRRTRDHHSRWKGFLNVVGTLDPRPLLNGKPPGYEPHWIDGVDTGRRVQGVVMTENDDCRASFISTNPLGALHPLGAQRENAKTRSESRFLSAATRTGTGEINDEGSDRCTKTPGRVPNRD
jgi:hypothetical protein